MFLPVVFKDLVRQLSDLSFCLRQYSPPCAGPVVNFAPPPVDPGKAGAHQAARLHTVQQRIDGSRPDPVAMAPQFLNYTEAEDSLLAGMVQDMNANETGVEIFDPLAWWFHDAIVKRA